VRHDAVAIVIPLPIVAAIRIVTDFLHSDRQPSLPRISNRSSYRASLINRTDRIAETQSSQVSLPSKFVDPFCISFTAFFALVSIHNANSCNEVNKEREREREGGVERGEKTRESRKLSSRIKTLASFVAAETRSPQQSIDRYHDDANRRRDDYIAIYIVLHYIS
jgi:hypothetical protein